MLLEKLTLTEKQPKKNEKKIQNREPSNIVEEKKKKVFKEPKKETAEDRAKKELNKIAAYQARLAKKGHKQKKIRTVMDDDKSLSNRKGILQLTAVYNSNSKILLFL